MYIKLYYKKIQDKGHLTPLYLWTSLRLSQKNRFEEVSITTQGGRPSRERHYCSREKKCLLPLCKFGPTLTVLTREIHRVQKTERYIIRYGTRCMVVRELTPWSTHPVLLVWPFPTDEKDKIRLVGESKDPERSGVRLGHKDTVSNPSGVDFFYLAPSKGINKTV